MTLHKKPLAIAGAVFGVLILVLVLLPLLFKDRIAARVQAEVDQAVDADVSWGDVELSFLRTFPSFTLGLRDLSVVGVDRFQGDTLAAMDRLRVSMTLGSVIRSLRGAGPLEVSSVRMESPLLQLQVPGEGGPSWDVLRAGDDEGAPDGGPGDGAGDGAGLAVQLRSFELTDGRVVFDNTRSGVFLSLEGLQHTLSGDFSRDSLVASTTTHADRATLEFAGTPYLPGGEVDFDADLSVNLAEGRVALRDNELRLNELLVGFAGEVAQEGEDLALDLTFDAPGTDFREILSIVPAVYAQDFQSLETSGRFAFTGSVTGRYGPEAFPSFSVTANVEDGSFQYPDLPLPARAISADLAIDNPGGDVDSTVVRLSRFHIEIGDQPIDAVVTVRTPASDPDVDATVRGTLDLDVPDREARERRGAERDRDRRRHGPRPPLGPRQRALRAGRRPGERHRP